MDYDLLDDFAEDDHSEYCEYQFEKEFDDELEPDLSDMINDDDVPFNHQALGLALGLAEEIAAEERYREIEKSTVPSEREAPEGTKFVPMKQDTEDKRPKFEKYVDSIIAGNNPRIPT